MRIKWCMVPRVLSILYIIFISLFALDVFGQFSGAELFIALFMHLIPSFLLIGALILAWKNSRYGGFAFIILGLFSIFFFNTYRHLAGFLVVTLPPIAIGIMFCFDCYLTRKYGK